MAWYSKYLILTLALSPTLRLKSHATRFADHHSDNAGEKPRPRKNPKLVPERNISKLEDEANFEPDYELGDSD